MKYNLNLGKKILLLSFAVFFFYSFEAKSQCTTTRLSKVFRKCNVNLDTTYIPKVADFSCGMNESLSQISQVLPAQVTMNGVKPCDSSFFSKIIRTWNLKVINTVTMAMRTEQYSDTICFLKIALSGEGDTIVCPKDTIIYCPLNGIIDTSIAALGSPLGNSNIPCNILQTAPIKIVWQYKSNGCYKFSRSWNLIDWCTGQTKVCTQVIEVRDTIKPIITTGILIIPNVSISGDLCTATLNLPAISATDNCSSAAQLKYSVTVDGVTIHTNGGMISGIHVGTHDVIYKVDDGCGNIATFIPIVTVYDGVPPLALCKGPKLVQLPQSGMITLPKSAFDDGSFDRCTHAVGIKVKRMNDLPVCRNSGNPFNKFDDNVKFCCADAGTDVMVIMRVSQGGGIPIGTVSLDYYTGIPYTECMVAVKVVDKVGPEIICPADTTIDCRDISKKRVKHPTNYGAVTIVNEMCLDTIIYDSIPHLDECGVGYIIRRITAKDDAGNISTCDQIIKVVNNTPFNAYDTADFFWPKDTTFFVCSANTGTSVTGVPVVKDPSCAKVVFNMSDEVYEFAPGACKKILRKWSVADWCQVDPNDINAGKWSRIQKIVVMDTVKPVLTAPADFMVNNFDSVCGPINVTVPLPTATDCTSSANLEWSYATDLFSDGIDIITRVGRNASQSLPNGMHTIEFKVSDKCGNFSTKKIKITVKDAKKPTPGAIHGLATDLSLMNGVGMVRILARLFFVNGSTTDNCTPFSKLKFSFSTNLNDTIKTFTCDSIGTRNVRVYVTDEAGNQDFVTTYILIQNNMNACTSPAPALRIAGLEGNIKNELGKPIDQVTVKIMNGNTALPDQTVIEGKFKSSDLYLGQSYEIIPQKDINPANGVSTVDLIVMQRHILGIKALTSPYKIIAADIDRDNDVTVSDLIELRKLILGIDTRFAKNESWRFVDVDYKFLDSKNPLKESFREKYPIIEMDRAMNIGFLGIKIGDVNESSLPNEFLQLENRGQENIALSIEDRSINKDEEILIPVLNKSALALQGLQMELNLNQVTFQSIVPGEFSKEEIFFNQIDNKLKLSLATTDIKMASDKPLFYIKLKPSSSGRLSQFIRILKDTSFQSEAYNDILESKSIRIDWNNAETKLFQNKPNPFKNFTTVHYTLPISAPVTLKIIDLQGKIIYSKSIKGLKGLNEWKIESSQLMGSGIYYYKLETPAGIYSNKMILIQ